MKTVTTTKTYATFNELSTQKQKQVLYKYSDYLVHENWYYPTQEQINMILEDLFNDKSDNIYFDTDRNSFCSFEIEVSLRDLLGLLESSKMQDIYPDLYTHLETEITGIKESYFYKNKNRLDLIYKNIYHPYLETTHKRNNIDTRVNLFIFTDYANLAKENERYENINNELTNLSDCIEQFFVSLSDYFSKMFTNELDYLYSDMALIEYFGEYDTHFDIETLEME
jgi:hypothetical protein